MEVDGINEKRRELKCMINIIKSKKKILFLVFLGIGLFGCSSGDRMSTKADELYKGLDAVQTYREAIDYSNDNLTYVRMKIFCDNLDYEWMSNREVFLNEGEYDFDRTYDCVDSFFYKEKDTEGHASVVIRITTPIDSLTNSASDEIVGFELLATENTNGTIDDYTFTENSGILPMYISSYKEKGVQIFDTTMEKKEDKIIIRHECSITWYDEVMKKEEIEYYKSDTIIGPEGYIIERNLTYYSDSKFKNQVGKKQILYTNYNKNKTYNYYEEKEKLERLEGKSVQEIVESIFD